MFFTALDELCCFIIITEKAGLAKLHLKEIAVKQILFSEGWFLSEVTCSHINIIINTFDTPVSDRTMNECWRPHLQ